MRKFVLILFAGLLLTAGFALLGCGPMHAYAQNPTRAKRLILKDGSYQVVTKWEVKGNRVHYLSAERYEWEEVPNSLVDWPATDKFNKEHESAATVNSADVAAVEAEERAERAREEAKAPTVAPGIKLPETGGVFLLDKYHDQQQLVELVQNGGELNKQMGKNIMRAVINPIPTGSRQTIELKGLRSRVQAHETAPVIFADIDNSDSGSSAGKQPSQPSIGPSGIGSASAPPPPTAAAGGDKSSATAGATLNQTDRFKIVRLQTKKESRVVSNVKISLLGKVTNEEVLIPTKSEAVNGGEWLKIVPLQPLTPGEYALVEMLGPKEINMYVWDFGYDPNSPPNPTAWKPQQPAQTQTGTTESPILTKRPK
jgi:hypothetical protein